MSFPELNSEEHSMNDRNEGYNEIPLGSEKRNDPQKHPRMEDEKVTKL